MTPLALHTQRSVKHFPNDSSGYYLTRSGWKYFEEVKNDGVFFHFLPENAICGVARRSSPEHVTVGEMAWMLRTIKDFGSSLKDLVKASNKHSDAFRLIAFLEIAHYQTSVALEQDKEKRTFGFDIEYFLNELAKLKLPVTT